MKSSLPLDSIRRALDSLKDFQRDTAEYVFSRLYGSDDPCRRILVSDEVGLGKTLVAKGVIARTLEHLWDRVKRIDVVYICSNADIARQNVNRLNVLGEKGGFRTAERLTLLAREISQLGDVNFIALTPGTSFDLGSSLGVARERALLYWLLREAWGLGSGVAPYNVLRGNVELDRFRARVAADQPKPAELAQLAQRFIKGLGPGGGEALRAEFDELCEQIGRRRGGLERSDRVLRNRFIAKIRAALARSCIEELNPDLVILDEFQRFKDILSGDDDAAELARSLFEYQDETSHAKVMLLSATPYRMLTLSSQGDDDDHYADFLKTIEFLVPNPTRFSEYRNAVEAFRMEFLKLRTSGDIEAILRAKTELAALLRKVIVRTERLSQTSDRSGMLGEKPLTESLTSGDLTSYVGAQGIAALVKQRDTIEFWKSAPFYLSFLEGYQMRERLRLAMKDADLSAQVANNLSKVGSGLLPMGAMASDAPIDASNARLRGFLDGYTREGATDLLWVPPSLPYYKLVGSYAAIDGKNMTKRLMFSSWRMVPRSLAAITSYIVANRLLLRDEQGGGRQSGGKGRWPSPLLRFQRDTDNRLTGMPVTTLIYPATYLGKLCDPLAVAGELAQKHGRLATLDEVRAALAERVQGRLYLLDRWMGKSATPDERWYWAAPVLFDLATGPRVASLFLMARGIAAIIQGGDEAEDGEDHWAKHIEELESLFKLPELGTVPPDLVDVLVDIGLGSPATCALRALRRGFEQVGEGDEVASLTQAARIGWALRNVFNLPEAIVMLRAGARSEPYWRLALRYAAEGGLQAVLDEYIHVMVDSDGLWDRKLEERFTDIADEVVSALQIRPAAIGADDFKVQPDGNGFAFETHRLKGRFAMPLVESRAEDTGVDAKAESQATRTTRVRNAFNSPFWPFVLISTSIGQEGLDFHRYCHAIVHWNLPTNPVDLEQREGRVHRFKGHAVRKNLAAEYGFSTLSEGTSDLWSKVFQRAADARPADANDLVPYWVYARPEGAVIERHVPSMPLTREAERIVDLRKTLAVYRMVFGQPRQEDLIEYLMTRFDEGERGRLINELRIDLSPPRRADCASS